MVLIASRPTFIQIFKKKSVEQFNQMMGQFDKGRIVALLVRRGGNSLYIPFRVEG